MSCLLTAAPSDASATAVRTVSVLGLVLPNVSCGDCQTCAQLSSHSLFLIIIMIIMIIIIITALTRHMANVHSKGTGPATAAGVAPTTAAEGPA